MTDWNMLTLVGADRPGIVARTTRTLYELGCMLGEASMMRLGGCFTIMLMVGGARPAEEIAAALAPLAAELDLRIHVEPSSGELHQHQLPNLQVRVSGADRAGIVADVTGVLAEHGFNIQVLESDVAGGREQPLYIMNIQGACEVSLETLTAALEPLRARAVAIEVAPVELLIG